MSGASHAYYARALSGERLPTAFVDLDRLDANIARLIARAGPLPIRIVTKSLRSVEILRYLQRKSPQFKGLLCYAPGEAAWLAELGFDDLVVAYPTVEPVDLALVAEQVRRGRSITLMVDDRAQLGPIARVGQSAGTVMPVAIDIDASTPLFGMRFGVFRSPVRTPDEAVALARAIAGNAALRLDGLMVSTAVRFQATGAE